MEHIYYRIKKEVELNNPVILYRSFPSLTEGENADVKEQLFTEKGLMDEKEETKKMLENILKGGKPVLSRDTQKGILHIAEPFYPKERLIIFGGGHIALPLVEIAARVGFLVTVIDDRPFFANKVRFPAADQVICEAFQKCFDELKITRNDYLVIITRGHRYDRECLEQILKFPETIYTGMIGSKRRVGIVKQELISCGYSAERLNRLCTPIGLEIGSSTPEEISISIIAQLIKRKRLDKKTAPFMVNRSDMDSDMLEQLTSLKEKRYCLVTVIDTSGSVPRGTGAKMLVDEIGQIIGSIGGGCSESAIMRTALEIIGTGRWKIVQINMTADEAEEDGMVCGGMMTVLLEDFDAKPSCPQREDLTEGGKVV